MHIGIFTVVITYNCKNHNLQTSRSQPKNVGIHVEIAEATRRADLRVLQIGVGIWGFKLWLHSNNKKNNTSRPTVDILPECLIHKMP